MKIWDNLFVGGIFRSDIFVFNQTISSGQTGDLIIIGTAGKVTRLTMLISSTATPQPGVSIDVDGTTLVGPDTLADTSTPSIGHFFVAPSIGLFTNVTGSNGSILDVFGEFITIKKDTGNTIVDIILSYETGEIK